MAIEPGDANELERLRVQAYAFTLLNGPPRRLGKSAIVAKRWSVPTYSEIGNVCLREIWGRFNLWVNSGQDLKSKRLLSLSGLGGSCAGSYGR